MQPQLGLFWRLRPTDRRLAALPVRACDDDVSDHPNQRQRHDCVGPTRSRTVAFAELFPRSTGCVVVSHHRRLIRGVPLCQPTVQPITHADTRVRWRSPSKASACGLKHWCSGSRPFALAAARPGPIRETRRSPPQEGWRPRPHRHSPGADPAATGGGDHALDTSFCGRGVPLVSVVAARLLAHCKPLQSSRSRRPHRPTSSTSFGGSHIPRRFKIHPKLSTSAS